jgi:hypothetical protein
MIRYAFCWVCLRRMAWWLQADQFRCVDCGARGLTAETIVRRSLDMGQWPSAATR